MPPTLVQVEWHDAWVDGTEPVTLSDVGLAHKPKTIVTLGWLLKQDETGVSLANEHYADEQVYRGRTFIPSGMLVAVTPYRLVKTPARARDGRDRPATLGTAVDPR